MRTEIESPSARDLMTPFIYQIPSGAPLSDCLRILDEKRVSALFICHDEAACEPDCDHAIPLGYYVISHTNIIQYLAEHQEPEVPPDLFRVPVSNIMRGPIQVLDEGLPVDKVIRYMNERGLKRVLLGKRGEPKGVLTTHDILTWNNAYFQESKPIFLIVMDNQTGIVMAKHLFTETFTGDVNQELIELYGGALTSIGMITDEVLAKSGSMRVIRKENYTILFEPREKVTGVLVCDKNSIELRRRLYDWMDKFLEEYRDIFESPMFANAKPGELPIDHLTGMFTPAKY